MFHGSFLRLCRHPIALHDHERIEGFPTFRLELELENTIVGCLTCRHRAQDLVLQRMTLPLVG